MEKKSIRVIGAIGYSTYLPRHFWSTIVALSLEYRYALKVDSSTRYGFKGIIYFGVIAALRRLSSSRDMMSAILAYPTSFLISACRPLPIAVEIDKATRTGTSAMKAIFVFSTLLRI